MPFLGMTRDELRQALEELDQAIFHHERWCEELNRTLVCRLAPDQRDVDENAHRHCRFGQWLYGPGAARLGRHPAFEEIAKAHERMHRAAKSLLDASTAGQTIELQRYERLVNALKEMRLEIANTKHELEDALLNIDPLSGAANRVGMLTKLREQHELVRRKAMACAIAMMDFDHFKGINDTHGHSAGDQVIAKTSQMILRNMRPYDALYRYGGEEFLIALPNTELAAARDILERLRGAIADMSFIDERGQEFHVTASFGLTMLDPDVPVERSIERADSALYAAKAAGRNRIVVWEPAMAQASSRPR